MADSSSTSSSRAAPSRGQAHELRRFALRAGAFVLLLLALDAGVGAVLRRMYFAQRSGQLAETTYIIDHMHQPVVVVGSSRAQHHYVPGLLAAALGRPCYNAGRDGQGMLFYAAVLEQVFARYRPEVVVLDLNPRDLEHDTKGYDRLSELLPYVAEHPSLRRTVVLRSRFERWKLLSRAYPFNSMVLSIVQHDLVRHSRTARDSGYVPLHEDLSRRKGPVNPRASLPVAPFDPVKRDALLRTLALARAGGTRVVVVCSPQFASDVAAGSRAQLAALLRGQGLELWDYVDDPAWLVPSLYSDEVHLNDTGARRFSTELGARLAAR